GGRGVVWGGGQPAPGRRPALKRVPPGAAGFVSVRLADVLKGPVMREFLKATGKQPSDLPKLADQFLGFDPTAVERLTLVLSAAPPEPPLLVIALTAPVKKDQVLASFKGIKVGPDGKKETLLPEKKQHQGKEYYASRRMAVYFASDRLLLIGPEARVQQQLEKDQTAAPAKGVLSDGLRQAAGKK